MKLKNKYGFTLIELLAVIVVLAIIALIATPIVMNTIKKSQKGAAERSTDSYIRQVETAVATKRLEGEILEGTYTINDKGNLEGNGLTEPLVIEMNGNKPTSGTIKISNGQVTTDSTMTVGSYEVSYNPTNKKYEATKKGSASTGDDKPTNPNTPSTTVVYRWSTDYKDIIKIGATIDPSNTSKFTKDASTLGKSYYLKHVLDKDNKVTESYACSIYNGKEYCLRGGKDNSGNSFYGYAEKEADYTGNMLILKQIKDAKIEGISCSFDANSSSCTDDSVRLIARSTDRVNAFDDEGTCYIRDDGSSYCTS